MKEKKPKKRELTVIVVNPKSKEEYDKMVENLNKVFKKRYTNKLEGYSYEK